MLDVFRKLFALLDKRERRNFFILVFLMIFVSLAEVFGVSTLLLLLNVLTKPEIIEEMPPLQWAYDFFEFTSISDYQTFLTVMVFVTILGSLMIKAAGSFAIIRYSTMRGYMISRRLLEGYLHQPYTWFLQRNSSEIGKNVLNEVDRVIGTVLTPALRMLANTIHASSLFIFLLVVEPVVALAATFVIGGGYMAIYFKLKPVFTRYGAEMLQTNRERFQLTQEATGGFKELKLLSLETHYVNRFGKPSRHFARLKAFLALMYEMPRYALEALTFGVLLGTILFMQVQTGGDLGSAIPTLGAFAFAVMRMLPAVQQVYQGFSSFRNGKPLLDHIYADYQSARENLNRGVDRKKHSNRLSLTRSLEVRNARFSYPNTSRSALRDLSLTIPAKSTIGIVGGTGAGKTTLVDLILGLLTLESGEIRVDDTLLDRGNMQSWRNSLGYVPQAIYLTDSTVAENIAFGVEPDKIDMEAVEQAAKTAALHDFVVNELDEGYKTIVGERGVRLSGGQRQRIGIARALYNNPEVLILDEATSALDNLTERAVMDAVHNIGHQKTVIMIAHRLSTVRSCDCIFLLEQGQVASQGTFEELVEKSDTFREMAKTA